MKYDKEKKIIGKRRPTRSPPYLICSVTNGAVQHGLPIRGPTAGTAAASTSSTCGCGATGAQGLGSACYGGTGEDRPRARAGGTVKRRRLEATAVDADAIADVVQ